MKQNIYDNEEFFLKYSEMRNSESGYNAGLEEPAVRSLLPDLSGKDVLDLGCGSGKFCRYAFEKGAESVTGVDISKNMIELAEKESNKSINFIISSIEDYDYPHEKFDVVVSSLAFHYVEKYEEVADRIFGCLRRDGVFIFSVEHPMVTCSCKGWIMDENGEKSAWQVDEYHNEGKRLTKWFVDDVVKYHRTVETYVNTLIKTGFQIASLNEPKPLPEYLEKRKEYFAPKMKRPPIIVIGCRKV